jgi:hypothetical protein
VLIKSLAAKEAELTFYAIGRVAKKGVSRFVRRKIVANIMQGKYWPEIQHKLAYSGVYLR